MDVELMELGNLSLQDNADHWSRDINCHTAETFHSVEEDVPVLTSNERDLDITVPVDVSQVMMQADVIAPDMNTNLSVLNNSLFSTTDEGYCSRSMSLTSRLPVQEKLHNGFVTCTGPLDLKTMFLQDDDGDTDLHVAIIQMDTSSVQTIINMIPRSEWLNICNHLLQTPLHLAVITQQVHIVRRLMTAGARVDVTDIQGDTPLHIACREGYVEIVRCLLHPVFYEETLLNGYEIPYQRIPQDLERRNAHGYTCLHLAALRTSLRILELLLINGADINVPDATSGRTSLHHAAETGNTMLLHFLLSQRRLDICCETYGGLTPLRLAAGRGHDDVVSILVMHGADAPDIENPDDLEEDGFTNRTTICT